MFKKTADNKPLGRIDSLIGVGTRVEGNVVFSGGLRVDGEIKGCVSAPEGVEGSTLVLSEQARIEGEVKVAHFVVDGAVVGPVTATETLELQSKARIVGDVTYATIEMHQGAIIEGRLIRYEGQTVELKVASLT